MTIKEFARKHHLSVHAIYSRARKMGIDLRDIKVDNSPLYREEDLNKLLPPNWTRKQGKRKKGSD